MLRNYIKVAVRNLQKHRLYSMINISGLTVGMTCLILITLYIQYEFSYEQHFTNAERIFNIYQQQKGNNFRGTDLFNTAPKPLAPALRRDFIEVESATTLQRDFALLRGEQEVFGEAGLYADEFLFEVFDIEVIFGEGPSALRDPNGILLTKTLAEKIFGGKDVIGRTLMFENQKELKVHGVVADAPKNQHLQYEYIAPYSLLSYYAEDDEESWGSNNYKAYVLLKPGVNSEQVESKFKQYSDRVDDAYANAPFTARYFLQPLNHMHLHSNMNFQLGTTGDIRYIYMLAGIGFIILLLASINYMNLATARSSRRAREIGMRKVLGARRNQLIAQLLGESFLVTLCAFMGAIILAKILLPGFNNIVDKEIPFDMTGSPWLAISVILCALLVGGLSGLYPAFYITALSPVKAFNGKLFDGVRARFSLRDALVIGQFSTAIVLAIGSLVIFQQLKFIQTKKLGYNRDQVIYVPVASEEINNNRETLRSTLLQNPDIAKVSYARVLPLNSNNQGVVNRWEGNDTEEEIWIYRNFVDQHFFDLFEMELLAGRNFSPDFGRDSTDGFILNEAAVQALGWTPQTAVGKRFNQGNVIGVIKDFHFQPFDLAIEPLFIKYITESFGNFNFLTLKVRSEQIEQTMQKVKDILTERFPNDVFNPRFMDDEYNQLYQSEMRFGQAFTIFTIIALFIACMGLFGLVSHSVLKRTKEIGIRKVLGASELNIVTSITGEFIRLVLLAIVIGSPLAYYIMQKWLQDYSYHIEIQWGVFAIAAVTSMIIALATISMQSIRAALANPVESLRDE